MRVWGWVSGSGFVLGILGVDFRVEGLRGYDADGRVLHVGNFGCGVLGFQVFWNEGVEQLFQLAKLKGISGINVPGSGVLRSVTVQG